MKKLILTALCSVAALASWAQVASGPCNMDEGTRVEWRLEEDGTLVVSGNGLMDYYQDKPAPWSAYRDKIVKVVLTEKLNNVGVGAFADCVNLKEVVLSPFVHSIGEYAFQNTALESLVLSDEMMEVGECAFKGCSKLTSVRFPRTFRKLSYEVFYGCTGLTSIELPPTVNHIDAYAFKGCTGLTRVELPRALEKMGVGAFRGCSNLVSVSVPSSVKLLEHAFNGCPKLKHLVLFSEDEVEMRGSDASFLGATLYVPRALIPAYKNDNFFREMAAIKAIEDGLPAGFKEEEKIDMNALLMSGVCGKEGDNVTWTLTKGGLMTLKGYGATVDYSRDHRTPWMLNRDDVKNVVIEEGITSIGDDMFVLCSSLQTISIPATVKRIGNRALMGCLALSSVEIPASVEELGERALGSSSLKTITFPASVKKMGMAVVGGCRELESAVLSLGIREISPYMFSGCEKLKSVTIPRSVTLIGEGAFWHCEALSSVSIPSSVTDIGDMAFDRCTSLQSGSLPKATHTGKDAFPKATVVTLQGE